MPRVLVVSSESAPAATATMDNQEPAHALEAFFAASARGLVEAQKALDAKGRESMSAWETHGLPPSSFAWARCRLSFAVAYSCQPKANQTGKTQIAISPRRESAGGLSLSFRYLFNPQGE